MLAAVNPAALIEQIERYLFSRGVRVAARPFQGANGIAGGLVKLKGRPLVVVDSSAPQVERLMVLADVLCSLNIELASVSMEVRRVVAKARARRRWLRCRLVGRINLNNPIWLQSTRLVRSPGLRACKGNDPQSSR